LKRTAATTGNDAGFAKSALKKVSY